MVKYVLASCLAVDLFVLLVGLVYMLRRNASAAQVLAFTLAWPWSLARAILAQARSVAWELAQIGRDTLKEIGRMY